jgi:circadian clock protein KaiB
LTGTSSILNVCHDTGEAIELLARRDGDELLVPRQNAGVEKVELVLFLNGASPNVARARTAADELRSRLPGMSTLEIVDVRERPELAEQHRVLATPMMVRVAPPPQRRVVGDVTNIEDALLALDLAHVQ